MVEANEQGDGVVRNVHYANWRTDLKADQGYSAELINIKDADVKDWDAVVNANYEFGPGQNTLIKAFISKVQLHPDKDCLGTRRKNADGTAGEYEWLTYNQVNVNISNLARGFMVNKLCPEIEAEGRTWRFCGVWARNRQEWFTTLFAGMHFNITNVGFYDAMSI